MPSGSFRDCLYTVSDGFVQLPPECLEGSSPQTVGGGRMRTEARAVVRRGKEPLEPVARLTRDDFGGSLSVWRSAREFGESSSSSPVRSRSLGTQPRETKSSPQQAGRGQLVRSCSDGLPGRVRMRAPAGQRPPRQLQKKLGDGSDTRIRMDAPHAKAFHASKDSAAHRVGKELERSTEGRPSPLRGGSKWRRGDTGVAPVDPSAPSERSPPPSDFDKVDTTWRTGDEGPLRLGRGGRQGGADKEACRVRVTDEGGGLLGYARVPEPSAYTGESEWRLGDPEPWALNGRPAVVPRERQLPPDQQVKPLPSPSIGSITRPHPALT